MTENLHAFELRLFFGCNIRNFKVDLTANKQFQSIRIIKVVTPIFRLVEIMEVSLKNILIISKGIFKENFHLCSGSLAYRFCPCEKSYGRLSRDTPPPPTLLET
jgi:hypothetical protein